MERVTTTAPQERDVVLFDGHCRFCSAQMKNLVALARPGAIVPRSFQEAGVLDAFPGLTHDACMEAMHLVRRDGRVFRGMAAAVEALASRPLVGWLARVYYVPGLRWLGDQAYAFIARHRYRLAGRAACEDGSCSLHDR